MNQKSVRNESVIDTIIENTSQWVDFQGDSLFTGLQEFYLILRKKATRNMPPFASYQTK